MNGPAWLGLDIGGTKTLGLVLADDRRTVLASERIDSLAHQGAEAVLDSAIELSRRLATQAGRVIGVGVGFAGLVDHGTGVVDSSVILPGWEGVCLQERCASSLDLPTVVDNDATLAGYSEFVARGEPAGLNMVALTVGTGIGGAILIEGEIYRGRCGTSAEFGNTTIDWSGRECISGNRGSLNTLASGRALCRRAAELADGHASSRLSGAPVTGEAVARAAESGDAAAIQAIDEAARALGAGIANAINIFNPDRVSLSGGLCNLGPDYLAAVRAEARARAFPVSARHAEIGFAIYGEQTCAHGAACLAAAGRRR